MYIFNYANANVSPTLWLIAWTTLFGEISNSPVMSNIRNYSTTKFQLEGVRSRFSGMN